MKVDMADHGPPISNDEVDELERTAGVVLPPEYRSFLLSFNGGEPNPSLVDVPGWSGSPTDVGTFFGLFRPRDSDNIIWNLELMRDGYPNAKVLPIASDSSSDIFCLDFSNPGACPVVMFEYGGAWQEGGYSPLFVADGFSDFLEMLYEEDLLATYQGDVEK